MKKSQLSKLNMIPNYSILPYAYVGKTFTYGHEFHLHLWTSNIKFQCCGKSVLVFTSLKIKKWYTTAISFMNEATALSIKLKKNTFFHVA